MNGARRPLVEPGPALTAAERARYSRHLLLPDLGELGQRRLKAARVLVIGAGGLGSPVLMYLAAAGVGTLGIVDDDTVEASNLQRQVLHGEPSVGQPKTRSAREAVAAINPLVTVIEHPLRLTAENALDLVGQYDLVIDGADNFATRYAVADASEMTGTPCVWGSVLRMQAQVSVFWPEVGPTYRDLFPEPPPAGTAPSCGEAGVLGMVCGVAGSLMAAEALKVITGAGQPLIGRLALFDLSAATWRELGVARDPARVPVTAVIETAGSCQRTNLVSVVELRAALAERDRGGSSFDLIDVRERVEFAGAHIRGARSMPLSRFAEVHAEELAASARPLVVTCQVGPRASAAADLLRRAGHRDIRLVDGGMDAWVAQGAPVESTTVHAR